MRAISWPRGKVCHLVADTDHAAITLCGTYFLRQSALRITPIKDAHMPLCKKCVAFCVACRAHGVDYETLPQLSSGRM